MLQLGAIMQSLLSAAPAAAPMETTARQPDRRLDRLLLRDHRR